MPGDWDSAVKAAQKILGDKAKIPEWPSKIDKADKDDIEKWLGFNKGRDSLKDQLVDVQDSNDALKNALSQFQDEVHESNLGLDPKNKEDKKKITDAQKILNKCLQDRIKSKEDNDKNLKELDKHLMSIINYKQGQ